MLQLAAVFSDHMVLQREKNIVVFGIGEVGAIITVSIPERKLYASTTVKEDGSWRLQFPPQPAGTGLSLFAKDSHTEIHFQDVAIGEVWLAGGQSNMEFPVKNAVNGKLELSRCERSRVRYYHVQRSGVMHAAYFQNERKNRWQMPNPTNVAEWSAVAYLAAKELSQKLGVVVGVIGCNYTGTSASCWVPSADRTHCLTSVLGSLPVRLPRKDRCRNGSRLRRISGISECMGKTDDCLLSGKPKNQVESGSGTLR